MSTQIGDYIVDGRIFPQSQLKFAACFAKKLAIEENRKVVLLQHDHFDGDFSTRVVDIFNP